MPTTPDPDLARARAVVLETTGATEALTREVIASFDSAPERCAS